MINQTQIITIFVIYASLSLVLYLLKTIMGETKYNQHIKNNIYYIPLVQMFDNLLVYDELILFKLILVLIIYIIINMNITGKLNSSEKTNIQSDTLKEIQNQIMDNMRANPEQLSPPTLP